MANKKATVPKEVRDLPLQALAPANEPLRRWGPRSAARGGGLLRGQRLAHLGDRAQDRLGQFLENVEFADLLRDTGKDQPQRFGIQGRRIRGDAVQRQATRTQMALKT